jgi:AraC-like DNA-binding protein
MDSILVQLFLEGGVQFDTGNRITYAHAGDIVIFDLAQPINNINQKFRHITMVWPRISVEAVVPSIHRWHGRCLPKDRPSTMLLKQHMITSYDLAPRFSQGEGLRVEASALALMEAALSGESLLAAEEKDPALKEMLTYQIKRHIRQNLGSVDLSPDQIAAYFGISRRQLYNLLKPVGGVARYQTHLRLQRCLADLQNPKNFQLNISEIAYRWGFSNLATFNRNFRTCFGINPSEARHSGMRSTQLLRPFMSNHSQLKGIQSEHQQWFMALGI